MSKRIGIDSAGDDALLPYRFYVKGNKFVSGSGTTYNIQVSGMTASGTVIATIPANAATGTINVTGNLP